MRITTWWHGRGGRRRGNRWGIIVGEVGFVVFVGLGVAHVWDGVGVLRCRCFRGFVGGVWEVFAGCEG